MSSLEFSEWMMHNTLEPFGDERNDIRMAINTAAVVNEVRSLVVAWTGSKQKPAKIEDYMPEFGASNQVQETAEQERERRKAAMIAKIMTLSAAGLGGPIVKI